MDDTAQTEDKHRQKIAASAQLPVNQVTPVTAESPLEIVGEGADLIRNNAEGVRKDLFGGGTTEIAPSNKLIAMLKGKLSRKIKPDEEVQEKEAA